jgi:phosphoglycolate phosphatase-like HAD superfamily hydrolase
VTEAHHVTTVVFDVGETLVDETMMWTRAAANAGVTPFTLMAVLGATIERGIHHNETWGILGVDHPEGMWVDEDWYPDAVPCIERLRGAGYRVCAVGNTPEFVEEHVGVHVEVLGSSQRWQIWKPDPRFFARIVEAVGVPPAKIAYVGDRVDNDVGPALAAGMVGVHIKRGPWGYLQRPPAEAIRIDSLDELPAVLR